MNLKINDLVQRVQSSKAYVLPIKISSAPYFQSETINLLILCSALKCVGSFAAHCTPATNRSGTVSHGLAHCTVNCKWLFVYLQSPNCHMCSAGNIYNTMDRLELIEFLDISIIFDRVHRLLLINWPRQFYSILLFLYAIFQTNCLHMNETIGNNWTKK